MKPVKTMQRYKCDFCQRRSTKSSMEMHEKICFRNPKRFCDYCKNKGYNMEEIAEGFSLQKVDCIYCSKFDKEQLKAIEAREEKLKQAAEVLEGVDIKEVPF